MNDSTPVPGQKNKVEFSADYFSRLSDVEFEYSCREECFLVLEFALHRMTDEQFDYCCKEIPWEVLFNAPDCLSPEQVTQCVSGCKTELLEYFRDGRVPPGLLQVLYKQVAHLDAEVAAAVWEAISREI